MYLSFILCGRNDDYGFGFNERLQNSLDNLAVLGDKYNLSAEVILVEWNTKENNAKLSELISWKSKSISLRVIEVSKSTHNAVSKTKVDAKKVNNIEFYEYVAKNVGARRANGEFLLFFNADIIFNENIIKHLSEKPLSDKYFYRIDKYELRRSLRKDFDVFRKLKTCEKNGYRNLGSRKSRKSFVYDKASGDFFLISKAKFEEMKGFAEIRCNGSGLDTMSLYCAMCVCGQKIFKKSMKIFHQRHKNRYNYYNKANCILYHPPIKEWYDKTLSAMRKKRINLNPNKDNWGFVGCHFNEIQIKDRL